MDDKIQKKKKKRKEKKGKKIEKSKGGGRFSVIRASNLRYRELYESERRLDFRGS
jgi:hypothetical protein